MPVRATLGLCLLMFLATSPASSLWASVPNARGLTIYQAPPEGHQGLVGDVKLYRRSHAVVIGIDAYRHLPALHGAVRDARAVAAELERQGFDVTLLLNEEASRGRIAGILGDLLPERLGPEDRALIYFAGHGVSTGRGDTAMGYLMPAEAKQERMRATGISMREMQNWFADYPSKHVMFVADACYSGLALSTRSVGLPKHLNDYLFEVTRRPVRLAMTAGGTGELAHEWRGHGLFTYFFLEAIRGAADANGDGIVTSDEIAAYVRPHVTQTARAQFGSSQNPQVGRLGEGEFVFLPGGGRPAQVAAVAPAPPPAPEVVEDPPLLPPLSARLREQGRLQRAAPDVVRLYTAARRAETSGRTAPETAAQAWQALGGVEAENPFRDDALQRAQEWLRYVEVRDEEGGRLRELLAMSNDEAPSAQKRRAIAAYRSQFGPDSLRAEVERMPAGEARLRLPARPYGAAGFVNGEAVGRLPWEGSVPSGEVEVRLVQRGVEYAQRVLVIPGIDVEPRGFARAKHYRWFWTRFSGGTDLLSRTNETALGALASMEVGAGLGEFSVATGYAYGFYQSAYSGRQHLLRLTFNGLRDRYRVYTGIEGGPMTDRLARPRMYEQEPFLGDEFDHLRGVNMEGVLQHGRVIYGLLGMDVLVWGGALVGVETFLGGASVSQAVDPYTDTSFSYRPPFDTMLGARLSVRADAVEWFR